MLEGKKDGWKALIALAPALIFLIVFMFFPIVNTFIMSFMENFQFKSGAGIFAINHRSTGIGFGEYINVLRNPLFITALKNTLVMVVISVPISIILSLLVAVVLNGIKRFQNVFQTIFFLPYVTNTIALGMVFKVMFGTNHGLVNYVLSWFGASPVAWLTNAASGGYWSSLFVIVVYTVWTGLAFKVLVFLSGLQSIDKQYYDAAKIDGASRGRIFSKITVPLLSPMIAYITITSFIGAFKSYENVIAIFGNGQYTFGPYGNTNMWITVVGFIYKTMPNMMQAGALSRASAGSVILLLIILAFTIIQLYVSKKRVNY